MNDVAFCAMLHHNPVQNVYVCCNDRRCNGGTVYVDLGACRNCTARERRVLVINVGDEE